MTGRVAVGWSMMDGVVLRLIETGADGQGRGIDVLEISRPDTLRDIADLGLTLPEAKQLLTRLQQAVVAAQATIMRYTAQTARAAAAGAAR